MPPRRRTTPTLPASATPTIAPRHRLAEASLRGLLEPPTSNAPPWTQELHRNGNLEKGPAATATVASRQATPHLRATTSEPRASSDGSAETAASKPRSSGDCGGARPSGTSKRVAGSGSPLVSQRETALAAAQPGTTPTHMAATTPNKKPENDALSPFYLSLACLLKTSVKSPNHIKGLSTIP